MKKQLPYKAGKFRGIMIIEGRSTGVKKATKDYPEWEDVKEGK